MPFGPYADFDSCVAAQSKDHDVETAKAICGKMQAAEETGGSNFVSYELDKNGDLFLKYYFADNSTTINESAVGKFSVGDHALEPADNEAIGLPFSILPRQDLSIKGDWHSWSPKPNATLDDHIAFARQYAPGHIVAMTKDSNLVSAAMNDIKSHNGRLAVVRITDKRARDAYTANPALIPRQVSPGFMNLETPNLNAINKVKWAHLAAVPRGAYGDKATLYASCIGGNECINHLVAASVKEIDEKTRQNYCPVGASENIANTSLGDFSEIKNSMSANANTTAEPVGSPTTTTPTTLSVSTNAPPKGAPINTGTQSKGIVKLKNPLQGVTPQGNNPQGQGQGQPTGEETEVAKLRSEVQKMQEIQQQAARREEIKKTIPKEIFIKKGKFDEKAFEAEVDKKLLSGESNEQIAEFYNLWLERDKLVTLLSQSGLSMPNADPNQPQEIPQAPVGGSAYIHTNYVTQTDVPAAENNDYEALKLKAVNELRRWTRGY